MQWKPLIARVSHKEDLAAKRSSLKDPRPESWLPSSGLARILASVLRKNNTPIPSKPLAQASNEKFVEEIYNRCRKLEGGSHLFDYCDVEPKHKKLLIRDLKDCLLKSSTSDFTFDELDTPQSALPAQIPADDSPQQGAPCPPATATSTRKREDLMDLPDPKRRKIVREVAQAAAEASMPSERMKKDDTDTGTSFRVPRGVPRISELFGVENIIRYFNEGPLDEFLTPEKGDRDHWYHRPIDRPILLCGPHKAGKTTVVEAIAQEHGIPLRVVRACDLCPQGNSDPRRVAQKVFADARRMSPCMLYLNNLHDVCPQDVGENGRSDLARHISQYMRDELRKITHQKTFFPEPKEEGIEEGKEEEVTESGEPATRVMVVASCDNTGSLEQNLMTEFKPLYMEPLARHDRLEMLKTNVLSGRWVLDAGIDLDVYAEQMNGFFAGDVMQLCRVISEQAKKRYRLSSGLNDHETECNKDNECPVRYHGLPVSKEHFIDALKEYTPTTRLNCAEIPTTTWAEVGGLDHVKDTLTDAIVTQIKLSKIAELRGDAPTHVLLHGPPGCGKTHIVRALANEAKAGFIQVDGPQIVDKYVGESERQLRQIFAQAEAASPCIIFFDEIDAITPQRTDDSSGSGKTGIVNQLLTLMNPASVQKGKQVFVVAATNRPDVMDDALKRSGRFGHKILVPLPDVAGCKAILKTRLKCAKYVKEECFDDKWLTKIATILEERGFSGADMQDIVQRSNLKKNRELRRIAEERGDVDLLRPEDLVIDRAIIESVIPDIVPLGKETASKYQ